MTIKTIDQQRFDELTEWCRNRPEDAAARIIHAEDWEDFVHPEMTRKKVGPYGYTVRGQDTTRDGRKVFVCEAKNSEAMCDIVMACNQNLTALINGVDCHIVWRGERGSFMFVAEEIGS